MPKAFNVKQYPIGADPQLVHLDMDQLQDRLNAAMDRMNDLTRRGFKHTPAMDAAKRAYCAASDMKDTRLKADVKLRKQRKWCRFQNAQKGAST